MKHFINIVGELHTASSTLAVEEVIDNSSYVVVVLLQQLLVQVAIQESHAHQPIHKIRIRFVGSLGGAYFACGGVYFFGSLKAIVVEVLSQLSPSHWIPSCVFSTVDSCSSSGVYLSESPTC